MTAPTRTLPTLPSRAPGRAAIKAGTLRGDRWWVAPLLTVVGLAVFVVYGVVRAFMQKYYWVDKYHYLTPFYSPCISNGCDPDAAHFGRFLPASALLPYASLSLPFLLGFRLTCYYYRRAYYRSYWASPPACAVPDKHKRYTGETRFPLILQNSHRYFFYIATLIALINAFDASLAFRKADGSFGLGLGNVILWVNVILLFGYTLGCHSCRHVVGGRLKHFSRHPMRYRLWTMVSRLNNRHMAWAWVTLYAVMLTDAYVMAVSAGWISDLRFVH